MSASVGKCDPTLHGGIVHTPDSEWYITEAVVDDTNPSHDARFVRVAMGKSFAGCSDHLPQALAHVFQNGAKYAVIRRDRDMPLSIRTGTASPTVMDLALTALLTSDVGARMTCSEAEAVKDLFVAAGREADAANWIAEHSDHDTDTTDLHHDLWVQRQGQR